MRAHPIRRPPPSDRRDILLELLRESLARGHWKVSVRRILMLRSLACTLPPEHEHRCQRLLDRCPPRELERMEEDVRAWVSMLEPPVRVQPSAPAVDRYEYLHALSRRAASDTTSLG